MFAMRAAVLCLLVETLFKVLQDPMEFACSQSASKSEQE